MIDYHTWHRIHHLHKAGGLNGTQIARELDLHPETVRKWLKRDRYERPVCAPRATKLDPFKSSIALMLSEHPYSARQIFQRLVADGYPGGYTQVKRYVRQIRPREMPAYLDLAFAPGECLQWDWAECGTLSVGQTTRRLYAFLMVLCYSRMLYVEFTLRRTTEHFLTCHRHGLEAFAGVTAAVMCDNDKVAVLRHDRGCPPVLTPRYQDFIGHYGFEEVRACNPYQAHEKGIVENAVRYLRGNFLAGRTLTSLDQANKAAAEWLDRVANCREHGKTRQRPVDMFEQERTALKPLPTYAYDCGVNQNVKANSKFRVCCDGNRYSVPAAYASRALVMRRYPGRILLHCEDRLIAEHCRCYDRGRDVVCPDHAKPLLEKRRRARRQQVLEAFLTLTPAAEHYHRELQLRELHALTHLRKIMALVDLHGPETVARALEDALEFKAFGADYIAGILAQRKRLLPPPGPLHLPRNQDLLELDVTPPDLNVYGDETEGDRDDEMGVPV